MNKAEAAALIATQDAFRAKNGHFSGMAPGVNLGQLKKAHRIVAGEEPEGFQAPADRSVHAGPLIPEAERAAQKPRIPLKSAAEGAQPEPAVPAVDPGTPPDGAPADPADPVEPPAIPPTE